LENEPRIEQWVNAINDAKQNLNEDKAMTKSKSFKKKWNGTMKLNTMYDYNSVTDLDPQEDLVAVEPGSGPKIEKEEVKAQFDIIKDNVDPVDAPIIQLKEDVIPVKKIEPKAIVPRIPIRNNDVLKNQ